MYSRSVKLAAIVIAAMLGLPAGYFVFAAITDCPNEAKPYRDHYREYVERAEQSWRHKIGRDASIDLKGRYPVVIRLRDKVCVSLEIKKGGLGGVPAYCFTVHDRKMIERHEEVE